jgi:hypothetical protein
VSGFSWAVKCVKQNSLLTFSRNSMAMTALFARFYRHPGSAILLQKQVFSKASIAKIVGVSLPLFTALSRQGGYAHTLKGYFYTNLGGPYILALAMARQVDRPEFREKR